MAKSLLDRSEPETVLQFERVAGLRLREALILSRHRGRRLGAVYLLGYSIETRLKAAYFRVEGVRFPTDAITPVIRNTAWSTIKSRYLPKQLPGAKQPNQHDLSLWSQLLVDEMAQRRPASTVAFRTELVRKAQSAYAIWNEGLRYRAVQPTRREWQRMVALANWFRSEYNRMI